ncbi:MAG: redox-sensing transcriptional repressor Rex [Desulfovibrionaceae bacterium]|nr:redox-sensing transcriptional repressor Rex [Desulfovibrionaceae bacterium]
MLDPNTLKNKHIPPATIKRLSTYVQVLEDLARDNIKVISSVPLAEACGVQSSQIRKDLAYFGEFGIRGVGYHVKSLIQAITSALGIDREWPMILVGVGNLGRAMINHLSANAQGFVIKAIFDCDPFKIGEKVHGFEVYPTQEIKHIVDALGIVIGIITTPPERAQRAAQFLIDAGITSILNFAKARLKVPETVQVEYVDFFRHMYALAFKHIQAGRHDL